ncbi:MAG: ATP-binding protein [Prolixibacteraceae bacterium]
MSRFSETLLKNIQHNEFNTINENLKAQMEFCNIDHVWIAQKNKHKIAIVDLVSTVPLENDLDFLLADTRLKEDWSTPFFVTIDSQLIALCATEILPANELEFTYFLVAGINWNQEYLDRLQLTWQKKLFIGSSDLLLTNNPGVRDTLMQLNVFVPLKGIDGLTKANLVSEIRLHEVGALNAKYNKYFNLSKILFVIFAMTLLSFIITKGFRPFNKISKSLANNSPDAIVSLLNNRDEFGQLSRLIFENFKQKQELIDEIQVRRSIESEFRKLAVATEHSPSAILITDDKGIIEYVNPRFTKITGYALDEVLGKDPSLLKSGFTKPEEYREIWKVISNGGIWKGEFRNLKKSGELYYESASISPILNENGSIAHYLGIKDDISEIKRNEELQRVIFNIAHSGGTATSLDDLIHQILVELGKLIDVSNYYLALYHEENDSFTIPYSSDLKEEVSSFSADKTLTAYVLNNRKSLLATDKVVNHLIMSGEVLPIGVKAKVWLGVPLMYDSNAYGVFVVLSYKNEKAFNHLDMEMLEFVSHEISAVVFRKQMNDDLRFALVKAQESDLLKSNFLANMSHEIRTPLNSILGFSNLIADPSTLPSKYVPYNSVIQKNGMQLLAVIDNLLDFSKIDTGQVKLSCSEFNIKHLLFDLIKEYYSMASDKGLEIIVDGLGNSNPMVKSDSKMVSKIFENLLSNAIKFTNEGYIDFSLSYEKEGVIINVKDTGIGISSDFVNQAFEKFKQGENSKTRKYGGNGLGLAITKSLVELLGGKIWFESELHKGTSFHVYLPTEIS